MDIDPKTDVKRRLHMRSIVYGLVVATVAAVASTIVLAVLLTRDSDDTEPCPQTQTDNGDTCVAIDVAVVGAGIGGAYTAWRLREQGLAVHLFEYSDRVGGRLYTAHLPGVPDVSVELGGMRFIPMFHRRMEDTARQLGLPVVEFPPAIGFSDDDMLYIRRTHVRRADLGGPTTPYNLAPAERGKSPGQLAWELFSNGTSFVEGGALTEDGLLDLKTRDGTALYNQSVTAAYHTMGASSEATLYFRDSLGFHSYGGSDSAALVVHARNPDIPRGPTPVMTIGTGMDQLPKAMVQQFLAANESHSLKVNQKFESIRSKGDGVYEMVFRRTETTGGHTELSLNGPTTKVCARKIVLTVPRYSLAQVDWDGFKDRRIHNYITKSVKDVPASKVFLAYDRPWWREVQLNFTHSLSDLPNRQTYDFGTSQQSNKSVLLVSYTDMEDVRIWRDLQTRGNPIPGIGVWANRVTDTVVEQAHGYLAELYNMSAGDIPGPVSGAMSLWDDYPYGAAWHTWQPGYRWGDVQRAMVQPAPAHPVFVATGSFVHGEGSAWAESALESVEEMHAKLLGS